MVKSKYKKGISITDANGREPKFGGPVKEAEAI